MFSGLIGNAVIEGDKALREWQRLWSAEEESERLDARQRETLDLQNRQLLWDQERDEANREATTLRDRTIREGQIEDNQLNYYNTLTSPTAKAQFIGQLMSEGNSYAPGLLASYSNELTLDPLKALDIVSAAFNPSDLTYVPDITLLSHAARTAGSAMGLTGKDLDSYISDAVEAGNARKNKGEEAQELDFSDRFTQSEQARATLQATQASTEVSKVQATVYEAQERTLTQNLALDAEKHIWASEDRMADLAYVTAQTEAIIQGTSQDAAFFGARLQGLMLDNEGKSLSNQTQSAIFNSVVDTYVANARAAGANADIAEVQATHALTNALLDIAGKENNLDQGRQALVLGQQQIRESQARVTSMGITDQATLQSIEEAQVGLVTKVVSSGLGSLLDSDIITETLTELVGADNAEDVRNQLRGIADRNLDEQDATTAANIAVANATEKYAERSALAEVELREEQIRGAVSNREYTDLQRDNFQRKADTDEWATRQGIAIQWGQLEHQRTQEQRIASNAAAAAGRVQTTAEIRDEAYKAAGITGNQLQSARDDLNQAVAEEGRYVQWAAVLHPESGATDQERATALSNLSLSFPEANLSAGNTEAFINANLGGWQSAIRVAEEAFQTRLYSVIDAGIGASGQILPPGAFGLAEDDPLYLNALQRNPAVKAHTTEQEANINQVNDLLQNIPVGTALVAGAATAFEILKEEMGEEVLAELKITSPAALQPYIDSVHQQYQSHFEPANQLMTEMGMDIYSPSQRRDSQLVATNALNKVYDIIAAVERQGVGGAYVPDLVALIDMLPSSLTGAVPRGNDDPTQYLEFLKDRLTTHLAHMQWLDYRVDSDVMNALRTGGQ